MQIGDLQDPDRPLPGGENGDVEPAQPEPVPFDHGGVTGTGDAEAEH